MPAHLFNVGKETVVAAMEWRPVNPPAGSTTEKERREIARRFNATHGINWEQGEGRKLMGLLVPGTPIKAKRGVSGAAWLALVAEKATIYVEHVQPGKIWILYAHDQRIDTRADRIISADEADTVLNELLDEARESGREFRVVLASKEIPLQAAMLSRVPVEHRTFAELVGNHPAPAGARIGQLVGIPPVYFAAAAVIVLFLVGGVAVWRYVAYVKEQEEVAARARRLQEERLANERLASLAQVRAAEAVARELGTDTKTPPASALVAGCMSAFDAVGRSAGGWRVMSIDCAPGTGASIALDLPGMGGVGNNMTLYQFAQRYKVKPGLTVDGHRANLSLPTNDPQPRDGLKPLDLPKRQEALMALGTRLQMTQMAIRGFVYQMSEPAPKKVMYVDPIKEKNPAATGTELLSEVEPSKSYHSGRITVTGHSLYDITSLNLDLPWISCDKLSIRLQGATVDWTLEGTYVLANG